MNDWESIYEQESVAITNERKSYPSASQKSAKKFFEFLSFAFLVGGFIALGLVFFTSISFVQATCLFIISYVIQPTDTDRYESQIKGVIEDLAHIRLNTTVIRKYIKSCTERRDNSS